MKYILFLLVTIMAISCAKQGGYTVGQPDPVDTSNWRNGYQYEGVLNPPPSTNNGLSGTRWILTKFVAGYSTSYPNDTLYFQTSNTYIVNSGVVRSYQLTSGVASTNKTLTLYSFFPFGGSNYAAEVGGTFIGDGVIDNAEFTNVQNTTSKIRAWFVKI
jgi:hypothetical protein